MRAGIRAAKLLGVAEPPRELEAIATATPSSIGKPEFRAFYSYAKSVRGHHMATGRRLDEGHVHEVLREHDEHDPDG
jgi:hypothetical protein